MRPTGSGRCAGRCRAGGQFVTFANWPAFRCCFFKLDFSICPLRVGAGKTHAPVAAARRLPFRQFFKPCLDFAPSIRIMDRISRAFVEPCFPEMPAYALSVVVLRIEGFY